MPVGPSFPALLALGWGVAPCFGWLSHDHRGQSGALAGIRQGPASKQGLGSTLLIYWDPESSSSRRELPPASPFLEHGGVVLLVQPGSAWTIITTLHGKVDGARRDQVDLLARVRFYRTFWLI